MSAPAGGGAYSRRRRQKRRLWFLCTQSESDCTYSVALEDGCIALEVRQWCVVYRQALSEKPVGLFFKKKFKNKTKKEVMLMAYSFFTRKSRQPPNKTLC